MNVKKQFMDGMFYQNPVTVQLLGMCSTMAITTTLFNGLGMGVSVLVILTLIPAVLASVWFFGLHALRVVVFQIGGQIGEVHRELDARAQHGGEAELR